MKKILDKYIPNREIIILGFGAEGKSTYRLLRKLYPTQKLTIADRKPEIKQSNELKNDGFLFIQCGNNYLKNLTEYDFIIKTPGIPSSTINAVPKEKILSQAQLFLEKYYKQIIGITGTKGKSTTTSLIHHILYSYNKNSCVAGNIGVPFFEIIDKIDDRTTIVCEYSAHQLEHIKVAPHISVLLNIFPEHLDHFKTYSLYRASKLNIFKKQNPNDIAIFLDDIDLDEEKLPKNVFRYAISKKTNEICFFENNKIVLKKEDNMQELFDANFQNLPGNHNLLNINAAAIACLQINTPLKVIINEIKSFKGLEHRLEYVGVFDEKIFYNDSIATIPEATIAALNALKSVKTLILGGFDRELNYKKLTEYLGSHIVEKIVLYGEVGKRLLIENELERQNICFYPKFSEAVTKAIALTKKGHICLLSPAAASYDQFKNFEERGSLFKSLIRKKVKE